jgi:DNA helicase II / ATP-dependent DNA helicase PcrA
MTRARDELHLIVPQRFFTHGQSVYGDRHVYALRTRFIPDELLGLFNRTAWPAAAAEPAAAGLARQRIRLDVGARLRSMWS